MCILQKRANASATHFVHAYNGLPRLPPVRCAGAACRALMMPDFTRFKQVAKLLSWQFCMWAAERRTQCMLCMIATWLDATRSAMAMVDQQNARLTVVYNAYA